METVNPPKVGIIGAGNVGSTACYALMIGGLVSEIVLLDINKDRARGEALDLSHGASFVKPVRIRAGSYEDLSGSRIIIIAAGVAQEPGETRLDLVHKNAAVFGNIIPQALQYCPEAIYLVVTNPVDILTYVTLKLSGLPPSKVIGSGTVLDSSRFRFLLSQHCGVDARNVHAHVVGEHGDTEVLVWSEANIAGIPFTEYCRYCERQCPPNWQQEVTDRVRKAAYEIINLKGATYYAVGLAITRIVEAIIRDEHSVLTVSGLVSGQHGVADIALSLPCIVTAQGIEKTLPLPMNSEELAAFRHSADTLKEVARQLKI